jgi:hypothetical protein
MNNQTFHSLHRETFHLANEVLIVDTHDRTHKMLDTLGGKSDTLQRKVCRTTCCVQNSLCARATIEAVELIVVRTMHQQRCKSK